MNDYVYIVKAESEEYGVIYLPEYAGSRWSQCAEKVMEKARQEGFKGNVYERLEELG